jgi:hypothetical protein
LLAIDFFVRKDGRAGRIDVLQVEDKYCGLEVSDANGVGFHPRTPFNENH